MGSGKSKSHTEPPGDGRLCKLAAVADEVLAKQKILAKKLFELADDLDKQQRKVRKAKVGLSAASAAGGVMAATGFGLSFVTFGSALVLTYIGTGIIVASNAGKAASSIAKRIIKRKKIADANKAVKAYTEAVQQFAPILEYFCEGLTSNKDKATLRRILTNSNVMTSSIRVSYLKSSDKLCSVCAKGHRIMSAAVLVEEIMAEIDGEDSPFDTGLDIVSWTAGMVSEASTFGRRSFKAFRSAARVIYLGDVALTGVGIIIDIGSIVYNSIKLNNKQPSEVAMLIRKLAEALDYGRLR